VISQLTEATIRRPRKGIDFWKETLGERQSTRQAKRPIRLGADEDEAHYTDTTINDTPTVEEALAGPQREKWLEAMENERQQLRQYGVYTVTNLPPTDKATDTKWVLLIKRKSDRSIEKYKARKVARGFSQMPGMHYEAFALIAGTETWKLILLLALYDQWEIEQWDIEAAYLNAPLHHTVYVEDQQADGSRQVWRLHKVLYGLKQAGKEWNDISKELMGEQGLERTIGDEDCYILRSEGYIICRIATHVDDCLVTAKTREILDMLYKKLNQVIRIDNRGIPTKFLGIECYIKKGENIILTQTNLIEKTAVTYGIAYGAKTPVKTAGIEDLLSHHNEMEPRATKRIYQSLMGSLTHIARTTRPDCKD
jgi:hypothetical protein